MDLLAGLAALALVGLYLYSRRTKRPPQGPLAAEATTLPELTPEALRSAVEAHPRTPVQVYQTALGNGALIAFGYSPGHDRVDVFAPTDAGGDAYAHCEFSLASMQWRTDPPPDQDEIRAILRDTFPG